MSEPSEARRPRRITQITAVAFRKAEADYCTLFALCADDSVWRLQEWRPGQWEEISTPPAGGTHEPAEPAAAEASRARR